MVTCSKHSYCKICRPDISKRFSLWAKHRYEDLHERELASQRQRGRVFSDETRAKMSISAKIRAAREGHPEVRLQTLEARKKMAEAKRGKPMHLKTRAALLAANTGVVFSEKRKQKIKAALIAHASECRDLCHNGTSPSKLAWIAYDLLLKDFEIVIPEARFGPYSVDFLLAEEWLGIEIDGEYWHHDRDHLSRDAYLLKEHQLLIVRLSEQEIRLLTPNAQPQPGAVEVGSSGMF